MTGPPSTDEQRHAGRTRHTPSASARNSRLPRRLPRTLLFALLGWGSLCAAEDPRQIVLRSAALDERDLQLRRNYTYHMEVTQRRYDRSGRLVRNESETYEVLVLYGTPYRRLIARDGRPLPPADERKEKEKLEKEAERRRRALEKDPGKPARDYERQIQLQRDLIREVADAYTFRLAGEERVDGHPAWVIEAEPLPGYRPRSRNARLLPAFRGRVWITKDDGRWVRVEAESIRTVSFGWILARLQPGARLVFEQKRVQDEIWLPSSAHMHVVARLGLVRRMEADVEVRFSNYRKFQADSRIVDTRELEPEGGP